MADLEAEVPMPTGFVLPGTTPASGALDLARTVVRRAERRCVTLVREGQLSNPEVRRYLNRMSLLLFVLGRYEEDRAGLEFLEPDSSECLCGCLRFFRGLPVISRT